MAVTEKAEQQELRSYVEDTLIRTLKAHSFRELSKDEAKMLMVLLLQNEQQFDEYISNEVKELRRIKQIYDFLLQVLNKRAEMLGISLEPQVVYMLMVLTQGNVGQCLVYLYFIAWKAREKNLGDNISLQTWSMQIFPTGVISDYAMSAAWDAQKINAEAFEGHLSSDNAIDYRELYESLIHGKEEA